MGAFNGTAADVDGRNDYLIGRKLIHQQADGSDIGYSIHGAYFVKVDIAYRYAVGVTFSFGDESINRHYIVFYLLRDIEVPPYDVFYIM